MVMVANLSCYRIPATTGNETGSRNRIADCQGQISIIKDRMLDQPRWSTICVTSEGYPGARCRCLRKPPIVLIAAEEQRAGVPYSNEYHIHQAGFWNTLAHKITLRHRSVQGPHLSFFWHSPSSLFKDFSRSYSWNSRANFSVIYQGVLF